MAAAVHLGVEQPAANLLRILLQSNKPPLVLLNKATGDMAATPPFEGSFDGGGDGDGDGEEEGKEDGAVMIEMVGSAVHAETKDGSV